MNNLKPKTLFVDAIIWIFLMILAAVVAFGLLRRDAQKSFGAISFGAFPQFRLQATNGQSFDNHHLKGHVWAIHRGSNSKVFDVASRLALIDQKTALGKRHLFILTFLDNPGLSFEPIVPSQYILLGTPQQVQNIFSRGTAIGDEYVLLVDQNGIIRGSYDLSSSDSLRSFQQNLMLLL